MAAAGRKMSSQKFPQRLVRGFSMLGTNIRTARRRHKNTMQDMAVRAGISIKTYREIERGSPLVSVGAYAMVLHVLGLDHGFFEVANPERDTGALLINLEELPERVVIRRKRRQQRDVVYAARDGGVDRQDDGVF